MGICGNRGGEFDHLKIKNLNAQGLTGEILKFLFDRYIRTIKICRCLRNAIGPDAVRKVETKTVEPFWIPAHWVKLIWSYTINFHDLS